MYVRGDGALRFPAPGKLVVINTPQQNNWNSSPAYAYNRNRVEPPRCTARPFGKVRVMESRATNADAKEREYR